MTIKEFSIIESYMKDCMEDAAHDCEHIYRVLYNALDIARTEPEADLDILIAACLLHDIARKEQFETGVCHAEAGAAKAYHFLLKQGWDKHWAEAVSHCIYTHRFRTSAPPATIEAKILFDADKLDATGAMGLARTLISKGTVGEPLYSVGESGEILDGSGEESPSLFQEYHIKLKGVYEDFYTARGGEIAAGRRQAAADFYSALVREASFGRATGEAALNSLLEEQS